MYSQPIQSTDGDCWKGGTVSSVNPYIGSHRPSVVILDNADQSRDGEAEASDKQ